jgi:hypothetical protein
MFLWGFFGYEGLTNQGIGGIMHARYGDRKVWDREVWPPKDYDAIYKNAQSPTTLHFPPLRPKLKNISKN